MKRPSATEMDRAMRSRDASYDAVFFVGVSTTGVFCRPSCPARKPNARNTAFFSSMQEALLAGFRPCKRCRPMDVNGRPPPWVRRLLVRIEQAPNQRLRDADLRTLSIDPTRARRFFQRHYGMTFQTYHRSRRLGLALAQLRTGADLNTVALASGYESNSGFREAFEKTFGQPPGRGRASAAVVARWIESPIGPLVMGATQEGICFLEFADRRALERQLAALRKRLGACVVPGENRHVKKLIAELERYFEGRLTEFTVPLIMAGTPFQKKVWSRLLEIPFGRTWSYERLARAVGNPGAVRAVGSANGANHISIVIPCHRVVRKNGELGGYGGGLWRKQHLLDLERRIER